MVYERSHSISQYRYRNVYNYFKFHYNNTVSQKDDIAKTNNIISIEQVWCDIQTLLQFTSISLDIDIYFKQVILHMQVDTIYVPHG